MLRWKADVMEQKHRNLLTCNRVYLVQNLELLQLLDYMIETQLLNDDDRESLQVTVICLNVA